MAKIVPPKKDVIRVGGVDFELQYVPNLREDNQNLHGDTNISTRIIRINSSDSKQMQAQTLFHECMHAALYVTGQTERLEEEEEEGIILALDHMLWPLLPELVERMNKS